MSTAAPVNDWLAIPALVEALNGDLKHKTWTDHRVRHHVRYAQTNGLADAGAIRRVGRRILVSKSRFLAWIEGCPSHWEEGREAA